ncbi:DUF2332 domain-containing protein [Blastococcus xanthinilyticus]|uniref:DUF2332 family protein n=1 Tax=Blastococcus xanthinilyticus TaxID=1564164 RepID=A0A5S5CZN6_9ACTN|nr:DUF2332 domain-containing protein [Blastococcus xanthinilyticus]TYP89220.1 hypothetical protein BD833_103377 [Blastococcus xanthinilyticus]
MPHPTPLAERYRREGGRQAARASALQGAVAVAVGKSVAALRALESAPVRARQPAVVLAALHDLALAGRAPALAAAYAAGDVDAAAAAAVDVLLRQPDGVLALAAGRRVRTDDPQRCAVLHPAVAEAARRAGADAVGLVDLLCAAGFGLQADRVGITYGDGRSLGDPSSPVQLSAGVVGDRPVPATAMPRVAARVGIDRDRVDVTVADGARWLRACLAPEARERRVRLDAELALTAAAPPVLLRGDPVELLPDAVARVPADALPVVTTTWALSQLTPGHRQRFLDRLRGAAAGRPVAWVSVEGVGVAPEVPTLGDRRASGHSLIGLTVLDGGAPRAEVLGRCWSRGRLLSWPAGGS